MKGFMEFGCVYLTLHPSNQNPPNRLGEDDGDGDGAVGDDDDDDDDAEEHCWPFRIRNCSLLDYTSHKLRIYYTNTSLSTLFLICIVLSHLGSLVSVETHCFSGSYRDTFVSVVLKVFSC